MLVYLSKKIAIPNDSRLYSIAWHGGKGWIACGGEEGLLKVLKLEVPQTREAKLKGLAAPSNLSMNQALEGHGGEVRVVKWNEQHNKLTSSDQHGLIVVWFLFKGLWYEEMINNRNRSIVKDMCWNKDGQKICIVYEDGAVIVGSVDGSRIWGKDLKGMSLTHVQWSPDGKVILFGTSKGDISVFDSHGTYNSKLTLHCLYNVTGVVKIAGIEWYNGLHGYLEPNCPCLAVAFDNGRTQIMRHELDEDPIKLDTGMVVKCIRWNQKGSILALAGFLRQEATQDKEFSLVQFYNPFGEHLHTLRVPGKNVSSMAWEGGGLRIALAIGSFIYFANIRHDYTWGYFSNTLVYAFNKPDKVEHCVVFWNTRTYEKHPKSVKGLMLIASCKDFCVLVTRSDDIPGQYAVLLCNSLGTPMDTRYIELEPSYVTISHTHILVGSKTVCYIWHYRSASSKMGVSELTHILSRKGKESQDRLIHVDDLPTGREEEPVDFSKANHVTLDPICCLCSSDKLMVVGRASGMLLCYSLPKLSLEHKHVVTCRPHRLALNCDSTKLSIIDINGVLSLFDLVGKNPDSGGVGGLLPLERKEVWDLKWAEDNPELFAIMEKTRMYIFRGLDPEEPVVLSGHLCLFEDMQVRSALLDEIMKDPENPTEDLVADMDIKSLRDSRELLQKVGIQDAYQFIEDNPHPRLWELLAESALEKLDFDMAEKAFVRCQDYPGIQLVKRLRILDSEAKQRAEVDVFYKRFDEAERAYLEMDRRDLAVDLRVKLGDWFRVVHLLKTGGGGGDDTLLMKAWNNIGDYYAERHKWQHALSYYLQGKNQEKLAECYYMLEDFEGLDKLAESLPENHSLLENLAKKFITVGMCEQAVSAYIKLNMVKEAIDCCVELNQWDLAVDLARKHKVRETEGLLLKYATHLLENNKILSAIELYRKARCFTDAAKLLTKIAKKATEMQLPPLKIKKIYVLAAILVENHNSKVREMKASTKQDGAKGASAASVATALQGLIHEDFSSASETTLVDNNWRGAEAYHYFMLAQSQLHGGKSEAALRTAMLLPDYEDLLPEIKIYSLLALCSSSVGAFHACSKAFIKLESTDGLSDDQLSTYGDMAVKIFTRHPPKDNKSSTPIVCPSCSETTSDWTTKCPSCTSRFPVCVMTGQPLPDYHQTWMCARCKHRADSKEILALKNCPLCHFPRE